MRDGRTRGPGCNCRNCENTNQFTMTMDEVEAEERQEGLTAREQSGLKTMMKICKRMNWKKTGKCMCMMIMAR